MRSDSRRGAIRTELFPDRNGQAREVHNLAAFIRDSIKRVDVTAPTGVAALNVGGMAIQRFCGMMLVLQPRQSNED